MVGTFHKETVGGDRFYDVLARLEKDPPNNIELLEFMFMCLSLGFDGRLRVEQGGVDKHMQIRNGLARIIRAQRGPVEQDLSPRWRGVERPHRALSAWKPIYIAVGVTATILALTFSTLTYLLGTSSDRLLGAMASIDRGVPPLLDRPAPPPPPPPPPPPDAGPDQVEVISGFLEPEINEGLIRVFQTATTITVRIKGVGMFASASDQLTEGYPERIERLANALKDQPGKLLIVGHSDNVPIKSRRFQSNMALSLARAESVMKQMSAILGPERLSAEGRADAEPVCNDGTPACTERNNSKEGRDENRRIEIILLKAES
jgi:type VI secretion system protein ImpK